MLNTILVALDDSEIGERVMETLDNLKISPNAQVILCHVFPSSDSTELPADRPHPNSPKLSYFQVEKQLQTYQEKLAVKSQLELVSGDPADEIIRLANIYKADLVVIGNRGLTGMKKIVLRSVSTQVMEEAHCSVLVVKSQG
ncbi:universal stress protein [Cylindrospermopsis raciborskii CENA303]|uniref:Universal stress protein n=1 Tax=Cylindrospermopsis raciborskii CENA303 TaxID=1170769 RepID=A0A1X4G600_9CYAN|nr:universal stress protein [Cylindrospermopsis raciborskii]OSO90057.1 universal stress protein [Cylindrospermopsis raciborskii CENA303]